MHICLAVFWNTKPSKEELAAIVEGNAKLG